jgi:hypothetical protein
MKQLMKEFFALGWCEPIKGVAGSVREGATESENGLELLAWIQVDVIARGLLGGGTPNHRRRYGVALVTGSDANRYPRSVGNHLIRRPGRC